MTLATTPAIIIGGWLGAGKTTLVNHLLRHAGGERLAVLVNDFGDLVIDADLIDGVAADGEVVALAGGCICCSFGADLLGALNRVMRREPPPDRVLIEASGVGLPAAIARTATLAPGLRIEGIVVLVDCDNLLARAADHYVGDTVLQQLRDADVLVLNKTDLASADALAGLERWLDATVPATPRVRAVQSQLLPELVLGLHRTERPFQTLSWPPQAAPIWSHASRELVGRVDLQSLLEHLLQAGARLLRAKGALTGLDGRRHLLQGVGRRLELHELQPGEPVPATDRLLLIGLGELDDLLPSILEHHPHT